MAQRFAGYAYWVNALVTEYGCPVRDELPKEKRELFRELARFILNNGFDNIAQIEGLWMFECWQLLSFALVYLIGGVDPSEWCGVEAFKNCNLDIIRKMMRHPRSRSPVRQTSTLIRPVYGNCACLNKLLACVFDCLCRPVQQDVQVMSTLEAAAAPTRAAPKKGPRAMIHDLQLASMSIKEASLWMEMARLESIVGSCRRSTPSVKSGISCYLAFVKAVCGCVERPFPPKLEWLQSWAMLFRNADTFGNYVGYVKTACLIVKADTSVFEHPGVMRAKRAVAKEGGSRARGKLWIRRQRVEDMLKLATRSPEYEAFARLFLMSYAFLLRLPSEALPMIVAGGEHMANAKSVVHIDWDKEQLVLELSRRKNKESGSRLVRTCWCKECPSTCPVHVLGKFVAEAEPGAALFAGITPASAIHALRRMLASLDVVKSELYRTHDLRRGHALDLQCSGAPLWQILEAGEWSSPAFLKYLDLHKLDTELVVQAHVNESDESDVDV